MAAVAKGWKPDRVRVPLAVALEFNAADRRKKRGRLEGVLVRGRERRRG